MENLDKINTELELADVRMMDTALKLGKLSRGLEKQHELVQIATDLISLSSRLTELRKEVK
jgi:hypothetical protein